jgi:hypothetical protein
MLEKIFFTLMFGTCALITAAMVVMVTDALGKVFFVLLFGISALCFFKVLGED